MGPRAAAMIAVVLLLAPVLEGCGRYTRRGSAPPTTSGGVSVGADLDLSKITTTTAPTTTAAPGQPTTTRRPAAQSPNPVTTTVDGFEMTLHVAGGTTHRAGEPFNMSLTVKNVSGQDRHYDPNQRTYFVMQTGDGSGSWRDSDCAPGEASGQEAKPIDAGETVTFEARYPGPADRLDNGDACRRPPGRYVLVAGMVWCTDDAIFGGTCDPSASHTTASGTIAVELT